MRNIETGENDGRRQPVDAVPTMGWLLLLAVPLVALKLAQLVLTPPTADEAYYWLWGQRLALSYYDHPPLVGWVQRLSAELFGWTLVGLRAAPAASFIACMVVVWYWSQRLARAVAMRVFLAGVIVWLAIPMLTRIQSLAHPDHLLILFGVLAGHFWALFHDGLENGERRWRFFYLGCAALGLAGLAKYNGVFIGLGFAAWVLLTARARGLLLSPHLWAGAALAVAMQAPVAAWNVAHDWPSFRYNLDSRIGQSLHDGFLGSFTSFALMSVMMLSPVVVVALVRFVAGRGVRNTPFETSGRWVLIVSTLVFTALCASNTVLHYWNLAAYLLFLPVAVFYLNSRLEFSIHAAYGVLIGIWIVALQAVYPGYKMNGGAIRDNDIAFGTAEIAEIVEAEEERIGVDLIATTDYRTAALLAYRAQRLDIVSIGPRRDQFDFWFDASAHKGADMLLLADDYLPVDDELEGAFERVTKVHEFTITRFGFAMHSYRLYLAEGFSGALD
ncbi:ArnT family glycosyltransferase [Oricola sp.]|uniref:ArnT family glycosyltransferase n=1 Tax=Oricola sp. TaxID=1979950 RepID=UPI003BA90F6D